MGEEIVNLELEELKLSNKNDFDNLFKNCYSKPGKPNFFKKSNNKYIILNFL
jgi:hypothetical protein